ncbi:hypothetical protein BGP77_09700 [Saccharospirillum sp. MSK14-1]|uniref:hypothetical protein n=1 Tax=Saccharospirillum sp. MSK14-1 TaxID=1897632 RepID=UPI000D38A87A|nr:hypothetical protein [Saccharospirillum sp. MSK14-1]PTY39015.1 hypothetical protein BGP77_09700 [Saccharospirillum sp. MSK14-1]
MAINSLHNILLEHSDIDPKALDRLLGELQYKDDARGLGRLVLRDRLIGFYDLMNLALNYDLFPRTQTMLKRLAEAREKHQIIKPQEHTTRYKLGNTTIMPSEALVLINPNLTIPIPKPNLARYPESGSDERQVVEMAVELIRLGQYPEAEMFLIDAQDEFAQSLRIKLLLIWLYLLCQYYDDAVEPYQQGLDLAPQDPMLLEYAGLTEQARNKHLLAIHFFQKLVQQPKIKASWHLLLGVSLEKARLPDEAGSHYRRYLEGGKNAKLLSFAKQRLNYLDS